MRVYVETTIPSYLTARLSRDLVVAGNQEVTQEWWERERHKHELYISIFVTKEASSGNPDAASKRLALLSGIRVLDANAEASAITAQLIARGALPEKAAQDAAHVGIASAHGMDVLLTWNCAHLANAAILKDVFKIVRDMGYEPPQICTPLELMGERES